MNIERVRLADVVSINPKLVATDKPKADDLVSFVSMAGISEKTMSIVAAEERTYAEVAKGYTPFERGDLLVAKITPCFENGKFARATGLQHRQAFGSTEFHVFRMSDRVDPSYLFHLLRTPAVRSAGTGRMKGAAGHRRVPAEFFAELLVPLPAVDEQKRIAQILDVAETLRVKRRESIAQLDALVQSTFLEMFGEPVARGWQEKRVEELASEKNAIRTGPFGSQLLHSEFVDVGIKVLGIDNVVSNSFRSGEPRFITPEKYEGLRRYTVYPGDVLITIMGTCGRCAIVPEGIEQSINTKHLCAITLDRETCLPEFMRACFLWHPAARDFLEQNAKGAIMSGLNMGIIKRLPLPMPPIELQREFVAISNAIDAQRMRSADHLAELETLFTSLQSRAFAGEL